ARWHGDMDNAVNRHVTHFGPGGSSRRVRCRPYAKHNACNRQSDQSDIKDPHVSLLGSPLGPTVFPRTSKARVNKVTDAKCATIWPTSLIWRYRFAPKAGVLDLGPPRFLATVEQ